MTRRRWEPYEIAFVRDVAGRAIVPDLARVLRRSESSVHQLRGRLGLMRRRRTFGPAFDAFVRAKHALGWSDTETSVAWGCERHTVCDRRKRLGIGHNAYSDHRRQRVRERTREQLRAAGLPTLAAVRVRAFGDYAAAAGWPRDLRPRHVQILDALWRIGPMTRRQLADAVGMPWKGSRRSLTSNDIEGSYLAHLQARGMVTRLIKAVRGPGRGKRHGNTDLYLLTPAAVLIRAGRKEHEHGEQQRQGRRFDPQAGSAGPARGRDAGVDGRHVGGCAKRPAA